MTPRTSRAVAAAATLAVIAGALVVPARAAPNQAAPLDNQPTPEPTSPSPSATPSSTPAEPSAPVETAISDVRGVNNTSGGKSMVTYQVSHDVSSHVEAGAVLPGARVPRDEHPEAFDGAWGDAGYMGAWLAQRGKIQFDVSSSMYESSYFSNRLYGLSFGEMESDPMEAGDFAEIAMGNVPLDAPLTWERERTSPATGRLEWDFARDDRSVAASYGGTTGDMDVLFIRGDVVARGGDVDARDAAISVNPLVFDLPRSYGDGAEAAYIITTFHPYSQYISGMHLEVDEARGKGILTASVRGYIPEARERVLASGAHIKEWHLPINGVVMLRDASNGGQSAAEGDQSRAAVGMPWGGRAVVGDGAHSRTLDVAPGTTVVAGQGSGVRVLGDEEDQEQSAADSTALGVATEELERAYAINHRLGNTMELTLGDRYYGLAIDPNYRGEGVLALRSVTRRETGTEYAGVMSVPFVVVDGEGIKLERSRLVDLRVLPTYKGATLTFTGHGGSDPLTKTRSLQGAVREVGLAIDAVYDLGDDRYAFLTSQSEPGVLPPGYVRTTVFVRDFRTGFRVASSPVQYWEIPEKGPVTYDGETIATEFSGTLDVFADTKEATAGRYRLDGSSLLPGRDGAITVVRAPGPLTAEPAPDPSASIDGVPLAFYYTVPPTGASLVRSFLLSDHEPQANPKPIGERCGEPTISDVPGDAIPPLDIQAAWFDVDDANLYANIQVTDLPERSPPGITYSWALHWRNEHSSRYVRAVLDEQGTWTFTPGFYNLEGTIPEYRFKRDEVFGDVKTGLNGVVRMWIPRDDLIYRDGEMLRDTSVRSHVNIPQQSPGGVTVFERPVEVDQSPVRSSPTWGRGGDYVMEPCGTQPTPTPTDSASPSPSESPQPEMSEVRFTEHSATSGQFSDETLFEAGLTDSGGEPIPEQELTFELAGEEATRTFTATTDGNGIASVTPSLTEAPGIYQLTVRYAGDDDHEASADTITFVVDKEDTDLELTVEGQGNKRALSARLSDRDTRDPGIAGRTIDFYADGELIGSTTTDDNGVGTLRPPPRYRGGKHDFEARFEGDDYYRSSASAA